MKPHRVGKPCEGGAFYWKQWGGKNTKRNCHRIDLEVGNDWVVKK
jgi:protein gp37